MSPYISVIASSNRIGGLDVLFSSLFNQSFKDFELILVDGLYEYRKDLIVEEAKKCFFTVKHVPQPNTGTSFAQAINIGIINSDGHIVYIIPDYTWVKSDCLQIHANFHKSEKPDPNCALIGHFWDCALPELDNKFYRKYASPEAIFYREKPNNFLEEERKNYNNYIEDLDSGKLNSLMWSIFKAPFNTNKNSNLFEISVQKPVKEEGIVDSTSCVFKNESYLLESVLDINGLDESMDSSHGWHDVDFAGRLNALKGTKLYHKPNALVYTINPRPIMYARYRTRPVFANETIWEKSVENNFQDPINTYSLKDKRNARFQVPIKMKSKKPHISIICPTMRIGGLDTVFNSLQNSTFKDFELILSDSLHPYRKDIVKEQAKKCNFSYKHIQPINDKFPIFSQASGTNSAIVQAEGDIILFVTDYRYFMPWTLQMHADFHQANPAFNIGYAPGSKFLLPAPIKNGVPNYGRNEDYLKYLEDLKSGKLNEFMWSIFEGNPFETPQDLSTWAEIDRLKIGYDPKTVIPKGTEVPHNQIFTQSESVKTEAVLLANGLNEGLDGAFNYVDIEFSMRLKSYFDFKWIGDDTNIIYRITGGDAMIAKGQLVEDVQNRAESIYKKYENGSKDPVNNWSLSEVRAKNLGLSAPESVKTRESTLDYFGRSFKIVDWNLIPGNNGTDNPWLDEMDIRKNHWNSLSPGEVVIDVGGCFGLYSLPALMQGCRVITFEPNKDFADLIVESAAMNGWSDRLQCHNIAIWNGTSFPEELSGPLLQWSNKDTVESTTLNEVTKYLDRVDMVKIDVEGAEAGVLEGAHLMIQKFKPSFLIEDHSEIISYSDKNKTRAAVISVLNQYGYIVTIDLLPPPPPQGGRWFILATHPDRIGIK